MPLSMEQMTALDNDGFVALPNVLTRKSLAQVCRRLDELLLAEGAEAGAEFKQEPGCKRLANLANKGEIFRELMLHPEILSGIEKVLGPSFKLSSINARFVQPNCELTQPLHADMGAIADERGFWVANTVWLLDDFSADNGAIRFVPGSHRLGNLPQNRLEDPLATHPNEVTVTGRAGSVILMNAHVWHGGLPNRTNEWRRAFHIFYCRRDKPQQQFQRELLSLDLQRQLSPVERDLLALDDAENEQLSVQAAVRSGFLK